MEAMPITPYDKQVITIKTVENDSVVEITIPISELTKYVK